MSDLKPCPTCEKKPEAYTRWRNTTALYSWYQCGDTYPCIIAHCIKPDVENQEQVMADSWNVKVMEEMQRE